MAVRDGFHTVTPYLIVRGVPQLLEFLQQAFGATEHFRSIGSAGGLHVEVKIGDSMVMIGGDGPRSGEPMPAMLFLYIEDVDAVYQRALQSGATSIMEPTDQPDGDRMAGVKDVCGNQWYMATHTDAIYYS